jgi:EmrB/QacA subfamily drug resistance transporter
LWTSRPPITHAGVVIAGQDRAVLAISTAIVRSDAGRWLAFIVMLTGGLLPSVDFFIINVSLPSIHASIGADPAELQLVISGYAASYAVFLITGGRLGDLYGRRRMFLIGMAGFVATNTLCGLATTPLQLVIGRVLQGVSAAMLVPQVLGSIRALFPSEAELAKALSFYGVMMGLAASIGQFSGGALVEWSPFGWGWRTVFLAKLPIGIPVMLVAWLIVPETSASRGRRLDLGGAVLVSLTLACLVLPLSEGRQQGWPAWTLVMLAAVPVLAWAFVRFEAWLTRRGASPLLDLSLMAIPTFRRGVLVGTLFFFTTAFYMLFGIYEQEGYGTDPLFTGMAILPYGVGLFVGPLVTAPLERLRPWLLTIGMVIQVAGYAGVAAVVAAGDDGWPVVLTVLIAGFGQGIAYPRLFNTALGDVAPHQAGVAAGVLTSALQIGAAISVVAIGSLFFAVLGNGVGRDAYGYAFGIAQTATSAALLIAMLLTIPRATRRRT